MNIWTPVLMFFSLGLLFLQVFRFNILITAASVLVNIALAVQPNTPYYVWLAAWALAWAQGIAGILIVVFGKKKTSDRHIG